MERIRVGLVGIGGMGGGHYYNYSKIENATLVAVCDIREEVAKGKMKDSNAKYYSNLDEMLENEDLDMVDICTPSYLHYEMCKKCLNKGLNVLCEKPMTLNSKEAKELVKLAKEKNKKFMIAHVVRFMNEYIYLRNVIESGELGRLIRLDMKRISSIPMWSYNDWMRKEELSGGVLTDLSIHDLDFVQSIFGMPLKASAVHYTLKGNSEYIVSNLEYNNLLVSCEGTWYNTNIPFSASFLAVFENGFVQLKEGKLTKNNKKVNLTKKNKENVNLGINVSNSDGYYNEMQYFVDCVMNNKKIKYVTPSSSKDSIVLVEKIKMHQKDI